MDFYQFQQSLRETNETMNLALKCAVIILERAQELPLIQREFALDMVNELISVHGQENSVDASNVFSRDKMLADF
jgi:hypothetical protein